VTYTNLSEYLLKLCSDLLENINLRSAVGVLELLESRIVDWFVIDAKDPNAIREIKTVVNLELYDCENVISETELP
jgi:hypothetical protein